MELVAMGVGLVLVVGYITAGIYLTKLSSRLLMRKPIWARSLSTAAVLSVFFAPGFVAGGHGVAFGPAWVAVVDSESNFYIMRAALVSLAVSFSIFFAGGVLVHRSRKHPEN
jgi:hypothetical protein